MDLLKPHKAGEPTDYFCMNCGQLRISLLLDKSKCGNCGSTDIVTGAFGTLDEIKLRREYHGRRRG